MKLRPYQESAVDAMLRHDRCLLNAPTGSGKTIIIGGLLKKRPEKTLIIVTTSQLRIQMANMLEEFELPNPIILSAKKLPNEDSRHYLHISTWQTLKNMCQIPRYNMVVSDEAHHISDTTLYGDIINSINPEHHYAVTATPERYDGIKELTKLCGGNCHTIEIEVLYEGGYLIRPSVHFIDTHCKFDIEEALSTWENKMFSDEQKLGRIKAVIGHDHDRNRKISDILGILDTDANKHMLVLSYTIAQCEELFSFYTECFPTRDEFLIHGQESAAEKRLFFEQIQQSTKSITFATQSFLGEGIDIPKLDTMVIATPFGGGAKTVQFAGRILRPYPGKTSVNIYDFYDEMIGIGEYWKAARRKQYAKLAPYEPLP